MKLKRFYGEKGHRSIKVEEKSCRSRLKKIKKLKREPKPIEVKDKIKSSDTLNLETQI